MKHRKILSLALTLALLFSIVPFANAAELKRELISTEIIDLGDGITLEIVKEKIIANPLTRASDTVSATATSTAKENGKVIGVLTLWAEFTYNGTSASAIDAECKPTPQTGYSYKSCSVSRSGAKATGKCTFYNDSVSAKATATLTCDKNGNIS